MKRSILVATVVALVIGAGLTYWLMRPPAAPSELVLYGNVDLRQVDLPFNGSERIAAVLVQEGDRVKAGPGAGPARYQPARAAGRQGARPSVAAQQQAVDRLHNGSRPEEIAQARAERRCRPRPTPRTRGVSAQRSRSLVATPGGRAVSQQDLDNAKAALDVAEARWP